MSIFIAPRVAIVLQVDATVTGPRLFIYFLGESLPIFYFSFKSLSSLVIDRNLIDFMSSNLYGYVIKMKCIVFDSVEINISNSEFPARYNEYLMHMFICWTQFWSA